MLVEYCPACAAVLGGPVICCGFGRLTHELDEQRRIKDQAFDRLAQVVHERDEARRERGVFFDLWKKAEDEIDEYKALLDALLAALVPAGQPARYVDLPGNVDALGRERDEARAAFEALATWLVLPGQVEIGDTPKARRLVYGRELTAQLKRPEHQTITAILAAAQAAADAFWEAQNGTPEEQEDT